MTPNTLLSALRAKPLLATAAGLICLFLLYGIIRHSGNGVPTQCQSAEATRARIAPLARGEVAAVQVLDHGQTLPRLTFANANGTPVRLDDFKGKAVLLNLWATWCAPCRQEMPALDALQAKLDRANFEVVAVNIDTRSPDAPKAWLTETGITQLAYYSDTTAKIFQDLKNAGQTFGMPTSLLIDRNGCQVARLDGPAAWSSEDAVTLIRSLIRT